MRGLTKYYPNSVHIEIIDLMEALEFCQGSCSGLC